MTDTLNKYDQSPVYTLVFSCRFIYYILALKGSIYTSIVNASFSEAYNIEVIPKIFQIHNYWVWIYFSWDVSTKPKLLSLHTTHTHTHTHTHTYLISAS